MKKGIIYSFIISMVICMIMPFNLNADAIDGEFDNDSVVGVQVEEYEELLSGVQGTRYRFNIILDGFYIGDFQIHVEYDSYNISTSNWDHINIDRTVYVCGYDTYFETWMRENWLPPSSITWSASVNNSDQCIYVGRMDSQQLINILNQFKNSYSTNSAVTNGFLNQLDQKIDLLLSIRQYNIPFESSNFINFYFNSGYEIYEWRDLYSYQFPIFNLKNNQDFDYRFFYNNLTYTYIFAINQNMWGSGSGTNILNYLDLSNFDYSYRSLNNSYFFNSPVNKTIELKIKLKSGLSNNAYHIKYVGNDCHIIPIFVANDENIQYVSTDFALLFGLSNKLLDDLDIIANGTQQSQSAAGDLDQGASDLASDISSYNQIESDYNNQMNQALNNIDFSDQFSNNQNFLSGASFVKTVFNSFMQIDILRIFFIVLCIVLIAKRFI